MICFFKSDNKLILSNLKSDFTKSVIPDPINWYVVTTGTKLYYYYADISSHLFMYWYIFCYSPMITANSVDIRGTTVLFDK